MGLPSQGIVVSKDLTVGKVLRVDKDFYVDPDNGNDSNVGSQASPWRTIAHFHQWLTSWDLLDGGVVLHLPSGNTNPLVMTSVVVPDCLENGRVIYLSEHDTQVVAPFAAGSGSNEFQVVGPLNNADRVGMALECVGGAGLNIRTTIADISHDTGAGTTTYYFCTQLYGIGTQSGYSWRVIRPATVIQSNSSAISGALGNFNANLDNAAIYLVNIKFTGKLALGKGQFWVNGLEADGGLSIRSGCEMGTGFAAYSAGVPNGPNWEGWTLNQVRVDHPATIVNTFLDQLGANTNLYGYVVGSWVRIFGTTAKLSLGGGTLWGTVDPFSGANSCTLQVNDANVSVSPYSPDCKFRVSNVQAAPASCIWASGSNASVYVRDVVLYSPSTAYLLRTSVQGVIIMDVYGFSQRFTSGTTQGTAQHLRSGGVITWNGAITISGVSHDIEIEGQYFSNSQLSTDSAVVTNRASGFAKVVKMFPDQTAFDQSFATYGPVLPLTQAAFTITSGAATLNVGAYNDHIASNTLSQGTTLTLSGGIDGSQGTIYVKQNATGGWTLAFSVAGRTILRGAGITDDNAQSGANTVTSYHYQYLTIASTPYVRITRVYL